MLCLKKRRTYSFTQGACADLPRRSKKDNNRYEGSLNMAITTLPRKNRSREERPSRMVLTVTEDTPADMLAGSMELLVQLPREHHLHTQRVTVQRSTPMMDLLVQIATAHKLAASSYTLQAIGERGLVLPHQPNTPIGALDALQVKLLPKQGTFMPRKPKQANQPFETTFRLQVHLPRNQLYVSRVSPKMNLGEILNEVCREKNLDRNKYELRHPANLEETLDLSLSLQDYHLQEVTLYAKQQGRTLSSALSSQDIMALQRQEERRRQQAKQSVFGFMFKKSKESSLSTDSLGGRSVSPARSDETGRSASPLQPPARPQRKRRPAPKPPVQAAVVEETSNNTTTTTVDVGGKEKMVISHSRNSSDSSGYHEASVLSDNPDSAGRLPETLPRRNRAPGATETPRKLAQTSQSSKSLGNLAMASGSLTRGISSTSLSSTGLRKKRIAPPPPVPRPLSSAISAQALERIVDSEESLTSDMDPSKPPSDIGAPSKASSDIDDRPKASSDIGITTITPKSIHDFKTEMSESTESSIRDSKIVVDPDISAPVESTSKVETARVASKKGGEDGPTETDLLLQKVSDTLSHALPNSSRVPPPLPPESNVPRESPKEHPIPEDVPPKTETSTKSKEKSKDKPEYSDTVLNASTPNVTLSSSQQDTSDYVSAIGDDLSITDWEYQLPAPPSAFRDTDSPVFDGYDTITLRSVEAFKEDVDRVDHVEEPVKTVVKSQPRGSKEKRVELENKSSGKQESFQSRCDTNVALKKEVISELESKIETGTFSQVTTKESEARRSVDNSSTPKIAPVDNTLSNFTITTYTKPKTLDIFNEVDQKNSDDRFIKSFATMTRNRSNMSDRDESRNGGSRKETTKSEDMKSTEGLEPKIRNQQEDRKWQYSSGDKTNVQRSRSYISMPSNAKYKEVYDFNEEAKGNRVTDFAEKKSTSITGLNMDSSRNEKFSQWRDNALKRQEECTKEKELQSLQVLKSILPQLKNAQQAEENVSKEYNSVIEKARSESVSSDHSVESNVVSTRESQVKSDYKVSPQEESTRRYVYTGPPAISLGSWSERPSINVQIKVDTDYKFSRSNTGNKTIVNINSKEDKDNSQSEASKNVLEKNNAKNNHAKHDVKTESVPLDKRGPDELTKKLITHTTASGFKKPTLNKVSIVESKFPSRNEDKPIVTGVELKKTFVERNETSRKDENEIDTTPVDFRELARTFEQDGFKVKPKRINTNRHSDYYGSSEMIEKINDSNLKQNGRANFEKVAKFEAPFKNQSFLNGTQNNGNPRTKRFTSVVGINTQNQNGNFTLKSNVNSAMKINLPMPVVKGFKIPSTESKINNTAVQNGLNDPVKKDPQPPKPPTMPVITGVTLKSTSARPKSMPVQIDPRDMLLESIRNFGGREKLKSAAKRY